MKSRKNITSKKTLFTAIVRRSWAELPPDALISVAEISRYTGVNHRTVLRHIGRGLLPKGLTIEKAKVEQWWKGLGETIKMGRPSRRRLAHARQRVLPLS